MPTFGRPISIEIRTISPIISLKCADFLVLTPACGCAGVHPGGRRELWVGNFIFFIFFLIFLPIHTNKSIDLSIRLPTYRSICSSMYLAIDSSIY